MKQYEGYLKQKFGNEYLLLAGGQHIELSSFKTVSSNWLSISKQNDVNFNTFIDNTANLHNYSSEELNIFRFYSESPQTYNLPCNDSLSFIFSIDNSKDWIRALHFDMRTSNIYTINKAQGTWGNWSKIITSDNISQYISSDSNYLPLNGGSMTGLLSVRNIGNTSSGVYSEGAMQIREYNYGGSQSDTWGNAPRLTWHWGGRVAAQIGLASNGYLYEAPATGTSFYRLVYESGTWGINVTGSAGSVAWSGISGKPFNWSGQGGQPSWLWGSNDGSNYYVWNPSNFSVNYANSAGYASSAGSAGSVAWSNVYNKVVNDNEFNFATGNYNRIWFNYGGAVAIPAYYFGNGQNSGGLAWCCSSSWQVQSDIRYKNILEFINISLDDVANAPIFKFKWTKSGDTNKISIGTSAQYFQSVLPESVEYDDDSDFYSLCYDKVALIASVIVARSLRNLKFKVDSLERELEELKNSNI